MDLKAIVMQELYKPRVLLHSSTVWNGEEEVGPSDAEAR